MSLSEFIATVPANKLAGAPVIFNGLEPRLLGYANSHSQADWLAIQNRVSATFCSRATVKLPNGQDSEPFFVLHGLRDTLRPSPPQ